MLKKCKLSGKKTVMKITEELVPSSPLKGDLARNSVQIAWKLSSFFKLQNSFVTINGSYSIAGEEIPHKQDKNQDE